MLIRLSENLRLRISNPVWLIVDPKPQLELQFVNSHRVEVPTLPEGYTLRVYRPEDESQVISLLNNVGIAFNTDYLKDALSICLPNGCFVIDHLKSKTIVSTMMARHVSSINHPFGGRIDWLATDPNHRGLGLGKISAKSATRRLQQAGYDDIWVTTDDQRIGALKIFHGIGFRPVISSSMEKRWQEVYKNLNLNSEILKVNSKT